LVNGSGTTASGDLIKAHQSSSMKSLCLSGLLSTNAFPSAQTRVQRVPGSARVLVGAAAGKVEKKCEKRDSRAIKLASV
jgi:hypothetical protein